MTTKEMYNTAYQAIRSIMNFNATDNCRFMAIVLLNDLPNDVVVNALKSYDNRDDFDPLEVDLCHRQWIRKGNNPMDYIPF